MKLTIYTKPGCHLCEDALVLLDRLTPQYKLEVREVNILDDMALYDAYHEKIPVIEAWDGRFGRLVAPITEMELRAYLDMVQRPPLPSMVNRKPGGEPLFDRVASYIGRHWLRLVVIAMATFVILPWAAAGFATLGWWMLADPIYTAYAFTCHQLPERAGTLFGYQVAFCYRNTALYGGMALFGALYGLARDRDVGWLRWMRKALPWWGFVLLLVPLAVDGVTHMLGMRDNMMEVMGMTDPVFDNFYVGSQALSLNWWLRILTGLLAALGAVWFAFPRMDKAVTESEALSLMYQQMAAMRQANVPG